MAETRLRSNATVTASAANFRQKGISCANIDVLTLQLKNTGANALTAFQVKARVDASAEYVTVKTSGFGNADAVSLFASSEPASLAAGASCIVQLDVSTYESVHIALAAAGGTTVELYASGAN